MFKRAGIRPFVRGALIGIVTLIVCCISEGQTARSIGCSLRVISHGVAGYCNRPTEMGYMLGCSRENVPVTLVSVRRLCELFESVAGPDGLSA